MANDKQYNIVDSVEALEAALARVREAQKIFSTYTQEQVDKIFKAAATAANKMRIPLAKLAVEETGMGIVEDKVIKNHFASEYIYNKYKDVKTCGVLEEDKAYGTTKIAEPIGVVAAVIPTTNPTSTAIFKTLICLKTRNGIIISPHPRAKGSTIAAAKVVAANIDEYLGYHHEITSGVEIPEASLKDKTPCGRVNLMERDACERVCDFNAVENCMTEKEAKQEAGRCLRCDHFGYGIFKGGRSTLW